MPIGNMRDRVQFQARGTPSEDEYGNQITGEFATQFTRSAEITPSRGLEAVTAARLEGRQVVDIRVRYDSDTVRITPDWRAVVPEGVTYAVTAPPRDPDRRRRFLIVTCQSGVAA